MTLTREQAMEFAEDKPSNPSDNETFSSISQRRYSRRGVLKGALMTGTALAIASFSRPGHAALDASFSFEEISHGVDHTHHVAPGYDADILLRWGDALFPDSPIFDPTNQSEASQLRQFG
ncbi:MAG: DUF839 domain-containing protein, partial [Alphaproteobacteria bacterium]|nr:DUF839 domain-containing protein [Alphaproteobacteria bacterium]